MSKLNNSFIIFTIFFILIYIYKPSIFFDYNDNLTPLRLNGQQVTNIYILHIFTIFLAFISHILASRLK
jgi:hypothetical protein